MHSLRKQRKMSNLVLRSVAAISASTFDIIPAILSWDGSLASPAHPEAYSASYSSLPPSPHQIPSRYSRETSSSQVQVADSVEPIRENGQDYSPDTLPSAFQVFQAKVYPVDRHAHLAKAIPSPLGSSMDSWASDPFDPSSAYRTIRILHFHLHHRTMGTEARENEMPSEGCW